MNFKKIIILIVICLMVAIFGMAFIVKASAENIQDRDYMEEMIAAAVAGDIELGRELEQLRNEKIDELNLPYEKIIFDELFLLSKLTYSENDHSWVSDKIILYTGQVVLNRMASPEFPNTMEDVIYAQGQYYWANTNKFKTSLPNERHVRLALRLLEGERPMPSSVVFQSNSPKGSGVYEKIHDRALGTTMYFCYSTYRTQYYDD